MVDISFQGAKLTLNCAGLSGANTSVLLDFGDEGAPVDFQSVEEVGSSGNLNGTLITWSRYQPIRMEVSLIPGSKSDKALRRLFYVQHIGGTGGQGIVDKSQVIINSASLSVPAITTTDEAAVEGGGSTTFSFGPGRMTVGQPGTGSNAEGKQTMRRYSFVFEKGSQS